MSNKSDIPECNPNYSSADLDFRDNNPKSQTSTLPFTQEADPVNHPPHYTSHLSGIEAIEVIRHMNFNLGNAMKYLWRAGIKDKKKHIEDLQKAIFYINDEIKRLQGDF